MPFSLLVEHLEVSLGFNAEMQKAYTIQYIPLYKTLNVLLSHEDALSEVLKSQRSEKMTMFREHTMGILLNLILY